MNKLKQLIYNNRHKLAEAFFHQDKNDKGIVGKVEWAKTLTKILDLDLPWLSLASRIVDLEPDGSINFVKFLERYRIVNDEDGLEWQQDMTRAVVKALYRHSSNLLDAFTLIDTDKSGFIDYQEFVDQMSAIDPSLTKDTLYDLMRMLDVNNDNTISYVEFASKFEVEFRNHVADKQNETWLMENLAKIGGKVLRDGNSKRAFDSFDEDGNGVISRGEFEKYLRILGFDYSKEQVERLLGTIDSNGDGNIDFNEFVDAFSVSDSGGWGKEAIERICSVLLQNKYYIRKAFRLFDQNRDGFVDREEFFVGMESVNEVLPKEQQLSKLQMEQLFAVVDKDKSGIIAYEEFLSSFAVLDRKHRKH